MAKSKRKLRIEDDGIEIGGEDHIDNEPQFPLTPNGVKLFVQLMDFAASKGAFPISEYGNVQNVYVAAMGFLSEHGHLDQSDEDSDG